MAAISTVPRPTRDVQLSIRHTLARMGDIIRSMTWGRSMVFSFPEGHTWDMATVEAVQRAWDAICDELDRLHVPYLSVFHMGAERGPHVHLVMPEKRIFGRLARIWTDHTGSRMVKQQQVEMPYRLADYLFLCPECRTTDCCHRPIRVPPAFKSLYSTGFAGTDAPGSLYSLGDLGMNHPLGGEGQASEGSRAEEEGGAAEGPPGEQSGLSNGQVVTVCQTQGAKQLQRPRPVTAVDLVAAMPQAPCGGGCGTLQPWGWTCLACRSQPP